MSNGFHGSCLDSDSSIAHTQSTQVRWTRHTQPCVWSERRVSVAERTAQMNSLYVLPAWVGRVHALPLPELEIRRTLVLHPK